MTCRFLEQASDADGVIQPSWLHLDTFQPQVWPAPAQARGQVWALAGTADAYLERARPRRSTVSGIASRPLAQTDALEPFSKVVVAFAPGPGRPGGHCRLRRAAADRRRSWSPRAARCAS